MEFVAFQTDNFSEEYPLLREIKEEVKEEVKDNACDVHFG